MPTYGFVDRYCSKIISRVVCRPTDVCRPIIVWPSTMGGFLMTHVFGIVAVLVYMSIFTPV